MGLALAETVPDRLQRTLHRLRDRGALEASDELLDRLAKTLRRRSRRLELLCFFLPLWYFHRHMERQKDEYLREADKLASQMVLLEPALTDTQSAEEAKAAKARVAEARERYQLIEEMPTWPVDPRTRHRFRTRNALLLMPVAGQFVGKSGPWKAVFDAFSRIGS